MIRRKWSHGFSSWAIVGVYRGRRLASFCELYRFLDEETTEKLIKWCGSRTSRLVSDGPITPPSFRPNGGTRHARSSALCGQEVVEPVIRKHSPLIVEWDRYYPEGHRTSDIYCCFSRPWGTSPRPGARSHSKG